MPSNPSTPQLKILVDINVFLDVLWKRKGRVASAAVLHCAKTGQIAGYVSALTIPVLYFLNRRRANETRSRQEAERITAGFTILALNESILKLALASPLPEFEDNIQFFSARTESVHFLVTRNKHHYRQPEITVVTPEELVAELRVRGILP